MTGNEITLEDDPSRMPVAYLVLGFKANRDAIINFYRNARWWINWVTDERTSEIAAQIQWLSSEIRAGRRRGVVCRTITDITIRNLVTCKKVVKRINELRHIDGIKCVFAVSDVEALAMVPMPDSDMHKLQFIHSESESIVSYKQQVFDALWQNSANAQSRIEELEQAYNPDQSGSQVSKELLDRFYVCTQCHATFIFSDEVGKHKKATGHLNMKEISMT